MGRPAGDCPRCRELERRIAKLEAIIRDLQARLGLDSNNSSKPPSSDPPGTPSDKKRKKRSGRKRGGQPGHRGKTRERFAPEQVDVTTPVSVERCPCCGDTIQHGESLEPSRHQVVEIPATAAFVTEYVRERKRCPSCGEIATAQLPADVPRGVIGPRLQAVQALLVGRYRMSRRECREAVEALYGYKARVSLGLLSTIEARTEAALAGCYAEAGEAIVNSPFAHADETSFGKKPARHWLWTACNWSISFFRIDKERSRRAFVKLLPDFTGVLVTDRYAAYDSHPPKRRQICWSHVQRDFQGLVDRGQSSAPAGHAGLRACKAVAQAWHDHQAGTLTRKGLASRLRPTQQTLQTSLRRYRNHPDKKVRALCRDLLKRWASLWTFTRNDCVEPTNNRAEREIRPAVLWRKTSFGTRSERGRRFVAAMLTVTRSLRTQNRHVLEFLVESIQSHRLGQPGPSLIPA